MAAVVDVNTDLANERRNASFDPDQLTYFLYKGPDLTRRKRFIQNLAIQEVAKNNFRPIVTLPQEGQYEQAFQRAAITVNLISQLDLKDIRDVFYLREAALPQMSHPLSLHSSMFLPTLEKQATEEQKARWLPLANSFQLVGTYAQTEMGHGTFLRGLETTATFDPATKEFIVNSPTLTSIKFWPGGLGKTANCCLVMAQLITKGENHGMHFFFVQIRDLNTHEPLPGITVGDIGTKFGFNSIDNGFLRLNNVRIPQENMLMKHSQVLEDGTYMKPKSNSLTYGTMTLIRTSLVTQVARGISMAVTIAVRYSAVRRQSEIKPGGGEVQVLDFQTQQMKLFPLIAAAYALTITGNSMNSLYYKITEQIERGALEELPQLHSLSAALKAISSWEATSGIELCRLACGGHGYSQASGLPKIYVQTTTAVTYEGENTVMMLQTARYLIKCCNALQQGQQLPSLVKYLESPQGGASQLDSNLHLEDLVTAYHHRSARMILSVAQRLQSAVKSGHKPHDAWNSNSLDLVQAATAHAKAYIIKAFVDTIPTFSGNLRPVMENLCRLYAVDGVLKSLGDFMQDGFINGKQATMLQSRLLELLAELRPNAVALVDAFDFPDAVLDSALGRWDGQVYQALYDYSLKSTLNEKQVLDAYHKYQRPFMESQWVKNKVVVTSNL